MLVGGKKSCEIKAAIHVQRESVERMEKRTKVARQRRNLVQVWAGGRAPT